MPRSQDKKAARWLVLSMVFSTVLLSYSLGQAVGSNRHGDNAADNMLMKFVVPLFFLSVLSSSWYLHSVIDSFTEAGCGTRARVAKWVEDLPPGFRIITEISVAVAAPFALLFILLLMFSLLLS